MIIQEVTDAPISDTPYVLDPGDSFDGTINSSGDTDFIGLNLEAGVTYTIEFQPDWYSGQVSYGVYDLDGFVGRVWGEGSAFTTFTALGTGVYEVSPSFGGYSTGGYALSLGIADETTIGTVDEIADYLTATFWEDFGVPPLRWDLDETRTLTIDLSAIAPEGRTTARLAFDKWAEISGLTFVETDGEADIRFEIVRDGAYVTFDETDGILNEMVVNLPSFIANYAYEPGELPFTVVMHEIGHTLGLGHPGPYNFVLPENPEPVFQNDNTAMTVMSYFQAGDALQTRADYGFEPVGPMLADIAAIRQLYGTTPLNLGDTVYQPRPDWRTEGSALATYAAAFLPTDQTFETEPGSRGIVDDGGIDTLDLSLALGVQVIDLDFSQTIARVDRNGGLMFSEDTIIENVIGAGGFGVEIYGNHVDNMIFVNGPDTIIDGRDGVDTSAYTRDRKEYIIEITDGEVTVLHRAATSNLTGDSHTNIEIFAFSDGTYDLEALAAPINEGVVLNEGEIELGAIRGTDFADEVFAVFNAGQATLGGGDDVAVKLSGGGEVSGDAGHDRIFGGTGDSDLAGGTGDDIIAGDGTSRYFGGDDLIDGGKGNDLLSGGPGADVFVFRPHDGQNTIATFLIDSDGVAQIEGSDFDPRIDRVQLTGFDNLSKVEIANAIAMSDEGATFTREDTSILFVGVNAADLPSDVFVLG